MNNEKFKTREEYLIAAIEACKPLFTGEGHTVPEVHVSTGWPSSRGTSQKKKALGECWAKEASADERPQIFISPILVDPLDAEPGARDGFGVLPVLVHEICHAVAGHKAGHGPAFKKVAVSVGLEGKMTSTVPSPALRETLQGISDVLGAYPHARLNVLLSGKKKQTTRMVKCECAECGYILRTTKKWIEVGVPHCPAGHGLMTAEIPEETEDGDDGEGD